MGGFTPPPPASFAKVVIAFNRPMTPGLCVGLVAAPEDQGPPPADPRSGFDLGITLWAEGGAT